MSDKMILIYGGKSAEHDISVLSSYSMLQHVDYNRYAVQIVMITKAGDWVKGPVLTEAPKAKEDMLLTYDGHQTEGYQGERITPGAIVEEDAVIFPLLHGPNGEDGTVQGLFETLDMPYVGTGVLASACAMDKWMTKSIIADQTNIPQVPYEGITLMDWHDKDAVMDRCEACLTYPMFVKPANMGSSVGITKAENRENLFKGIEEAFRYDRRIVVEQGVEAREIEIAVLGNDEVKTTVPGEVVKNVDFYDFEEKYINNDVTLQIPAEIPADVQEKARQYAKEAYMALDCTGLTRCDLFLTKDNELYLNELNTMPGFTPFSMYPLMWEEMGLSYPELINELIRLAKERHHNKKRLMA